MKTFGQLTAKQRVEAVARATEILIDHVVNGVIILQMQNANAQAHWEHVLTNARRNETPNDAKQALLTHQPFRVVVDKIAIAAAEGSMYDLDGNIFQNERTLQ